MNERIKQLETEAYSHVNSLIGPDDYPTENAYCWNHRVMFNQKFAELIVRECATLAFDGPNGILEHFGLGVEK